MDYAKISLNGSEYQSSEGVRLTQGDNKLVTYGFQILGLNRRPFNLSATVVTLLAQNPIGEVVTIPAKVVGSSNGLVEVRFDNVASSVEGVFSRAYFNLERDDEQFATGNIRIEVRKAVDLTAKDATKYVSLLDKLLVQFNSSFDNFMTTTKEAVDGLLANVNSAFESFMTDSRNSMSGMEERFSKMLPLNGKTNILNDSIPVTKLDFVEVGKNLFNKDDTVSGYVDPKNGNIVTNTSYKTSDFINIQSQALTLSNIRFYATYSLDKVFISGGTLAVNEVKTLPQNGEYLIRVTPHSNTLNTAQVEYGTSATGYEPFKAKLKGVTANVASNDNTDVNLPKKLYATVGKTITIYTQNLMKHDIGQFNFNFNGGTQLEKSYLAKYSANGTLQLDIYDLDGNILKTESHEVIASAPRTTPIKALLLGDSTVKSENDVNGVLGRAMKTELGDNLTLVGTQGTAPYQHEGRAGWKFTDYRKAQTGSTTNAFFNPAKSDFDFQYYLTSTGVDKPNVVFIQLGINDVFYNSSDATVEASIKTMVTDLTFIKSSIKAVDPAIKVVYNLPTPPTSNVDQFARNYPNTKYTQWRVRLNNNLVVKRMIETFEGTDIDLLAINASIDVENNIRDGVHPTNDGYAQIAQTLCAYLNSIG